MPPDDPMLPDDPGAAERGGERRRALRAERDRQTERQQPDDPPSVPPALVRPYAAPPQDSALLLVDAPATPAPGVPGDSGPEAVDSPDPEGPDSPDPEGPVSPGPEAPPAPVASEPPGWSAFTPVIPPEPLRFDDESPAAWERERTWAPAPPPGASWMDVEESPAPADADVPQDPAADTVWTAPRGLEQVPASPPPVEPEPERSEVTGPPVRFDELGDDEWLRHLRDGLSDAPVAAHPDPLH